MVSFYHIDLLPLLCPGCVQSITVTSEMFFKSLDLERDLSWPQCVTGRCFVRNRILLLIDEQLLPYVHTSFSSCAADHLTACDISDNAQLLCEDQP
jgi:hypothetical protein